MPGNKRGFMCYVRRAGRETYLYEYQCFYDFLQTEYVTGFVPESLNLSEDNICTIRLHAYE